MERRLRQRQACFEKYLLDQFPEEASTLILRSWVVVVGCTCHDLHNALKWAVLLQLASKEIMRDCWVVLQSLRQSSRQMHRTLREWLGGVVGYKNGDPALLGAMYVLFGVDEPWMPLF